MDLERVIAALAPRDVVGRAPLDVADLAYDTRAVTPGALFFCVRGANVDGHELAPQAVAAGSVALVVERPLSPQVPQLVVADSRAAMATAADVFFGHPTHELEVAGVTGTNGKTTTAHLVYSILAAAGRRPGLLGTIEARVAGERRPVVRTTPEAIDLQRTFREMLDAGDRSCAMEASSHATALHRLDRVRFAALVFTNLTPEHLDFHGTMERYYDAKRRLFVEGERPPAAINVGDPWGRKLAAERPDALTFGLADDAQLGPAVLDGIDLKLRGRFNVENALGAVAAARILGIDDAVVARGLEAVRGVPGRFESVDEGQPFEVVVDYSHTPDSLENALRAARDLAATGRVLCVFGCGGDRDRDKRPLMGRVASELADVPILTTDNPRSEDPLAIIGEVLTGVSGEVEVEPDRRAAIARAVEAAREGDVVLVAGRGAEPAQEVAGRMLPFDDRDVAREALRRLQAVA
ncbi:MAG TPA: UDP-N-acetylmuramoyl-L-alanyl-D-glutamate--2,6-diaminopimelate ligase [Gaiellaceae bacterium]|jgi:UDP-N-acetylmuramoyl-L-alanyl-D-glutamate--2,6-diaminopimelate ligase|nr:UDP-N-acetylmuramoyl-L-alanyl-D-glutamate--2,6-diaminopimelate ligase [Gaiellaceae bacterium]